MAYSIVVLRDRAYGRGQLVKSHRGPWHLYQSHSCSRLVQSLSSLAHFTRTDPVQREDTDNSFIVRSRRGF